MDAERRQWLEQFLPRTPFFGGLTKGQLEGVLDRLVERPFPTGAEVFHEGDTGRSMFLVETGELLARQSGAGGHSVKLMRLKPGDFFGETTLIEMQPRPFSVVVEHPARLHELTSNDLYALYKSDVDAYVLVLQNINRELCRRLRQAGNRLTDIAAARDDDDTQIDLSQVRRRP